MILVSCNWFCLVQIYQGKVKQISLGLLNVIDIDDDRDCLPIFGEFLIFQIVLEENNTTTTIFVRSRQQIISLGSLLSDFT